VKRALKWLFVAWLLSEWWTRGGREMILGDKDKVQWQDLDSFRAWVDMPPGTKLHEVKPGTVVTNPRGVEVGRIVSSRLKPDVPFGGEIVQARGEYLRAPLGWPINVAVAEAETYTRTAVRGAYAA
jgi:hypothetical protein